MPGESFSQVYNSPTEYDGEPIPRLGDVIASKIAGRPINISQRQFAMNVTAVDSQGGFELLPTLYPQIVDLYRSAMVMVRAGAMQIPMTSPEMRILKMTKSVEANFRSEGAPIPSSSASFALYTMRARTVGAITTLSMEMIEDTRNVAAMIERSMSTALAHAIDESVIGVFDSAESHDEPTGIINTDGINQLFSVGTPTGYRDVTDSVGMILDNNYAGEVSELSWIMNPREGRTYDSLTDTTGQPLQPTPWANQLRRLSTTALPKDDGGSNNQSTALIGDFSEVLIGTLGGIRFQTFDTGTVDGVNAIENWSRHLRMITRVDSAILNPAMITKMTGITEA